MLNKSVTMNFIEVFVSFILIVILYMYLENNSYDIKYVTSSVDGRDYLVRNMEDKNGAADLLASIRARLIKLINFIKNMNDEEIERYISKGDKLSDAKENLNRLVDNFQPDNLSESTPNDQFTSFSVNKGEKIVLCLRNRGNDEKLVRENTMTFVALHELGHIMTKSIGHTDEFWNNFRIILRIAIAKKLYQNQNFNQSPVNYCGNKITDTPLDQNDPVLKK